VSWTIEIASGAFSADEAEAWDELEFLREEDEQREYGTPPSAEMNALYERLTAKYPCITEDPNSPWSDGPLINDFGDKLTTLGFVSSGMAEAYPFVIATATGMGFTVFDAADEKIHRPTGWQPTVPSERTTESSSIPQSHRPWWKVW
jgi:hypothetical protein